MVHYRSRWYVDAYCHASEGLRTFAIENIRRAEVLPRSAKRVSTREIETELDKSYGLFHSGELKTALLVFDEGSLNRKHRHGGGACGIARGCLDFGVAHY